MNERKNKENKNKWKKKGSEYRKQLAVRTGVV